VRTFAAKIIPPQAAQKLYEPVSVCDRVSAPLQRPTTGSGFDFGRIAVFSPSLTRSFPIQPKLTIGAVNDPMEHEADSAAEAILRMAEPAPEAPLAPSGAAVSVQRKCACGASCAKCEDEADRVQMKSLGPRTTADAVSAPPTVHEALRSPGRPLDPEVRAFMEPRFGHDFSQVRLHSDTAAAESAQALHAHAYTLGQDIVFGSGKLAPATKQGTRLLAHELTHVVQQGQGARQIQRDDKGSGDDPEYATGAEVEKALVNYLKTAWEVQGGRYLRVDDNVRTAVSKLAGSAGVDPNDLSHMSIEDFAKSVRKVLGEKIPRSQMVHLYKLPEKKHVPSKSWLEKKKEEANKKLGEIGKRPEDVRSPSGQVYPPGGEPKIGGDSPGQHTSPSVPVDPAGDVIDKGTGGPIAKNPPPSQPQGTPATNQESDVTDVTTPTGFGRRRREGPTEPFLRSPVPAVPTMDLGESLAESASPKMAAAIGSVTIDGFVTGKEDIPGTKVDRLTSTAKIIVALLKRYPASTIRVTGHTDAVGKEDDNEGLGQRRADSAKAFLVEQGIPAEAIQIQSAGATQLLVNTKNAEPKNRRVEILFDTSTVLSDFGRPSAVQP
jgi:outer membrane protein OmpA-like peptidoglycan-associated protein